jgi:N-acyl-L-homoserine lactone synthetase
MTQGNLRCVTRRMSIGDPLAQAFGRFRKQLFVDKLGWTLETRGEIEFDEFDTENAIFTVLIQNSVIIGGFRAIRTDNAYLASAVFPQLACWRPYPVSPDCWEISRFGVLCGENAGAVAQANYSAMFRFALRRQATALVALADPRHPHPALRTADRDRSRQGRPAAAGARRGDPADRPAQPPLPLPPQDRQRHGDRR